MPTTPSEPLRVVSYGGGVQSTALLVLAAQGYIDFPTFLFSNVGDDSEHPATLRYVREVAFDYAAAHGITIHELHRVPRRGPDAGKPETLWGRLMKADSRSLPIPVRMPDTGAPGTRSCTADFKIRVVQRWVVEHGATAENPATTAIGISTDEYQRATSRKREPYENLTYPLLTLEWKGGTGLNRSDCMDVIRSAGLPVPPKSSCFFCPFHRPHVWAEMRRDEPDLFDRAAFLEATLNERRDRLPCGRSGEPATIRVEAPGCETHGPGCPLDHLAPEGYEGEGDFCERRWEVRAVPPGAPFRCCSRDLRVADDGTIPPHGKDHVYLTRFGKPLPDAIAAAQAGLFDPGWDEDDGYRCGDVCDT